MKSELLVLLFKRNHFSTVEGILVLKFQSYILPSKTSINSEPESYPFYCLGAILFFRAVTAFFCKNFIPAQTYSILPLRSIPFYQLRTRYSIENFFANSEFPFSLTQSFFIHQVRAPSFLSTQSLLLLSSLSTSATDDLECRWAVSSVLGATVRVFGLLILSQPPLPKIAERVTEVEKKNLVGKWNWGAIMYLWWTQTITNISHVV